MALVVSLQRKRPYALRHGVNIYRDTRGVATDCCRTKGCARRSLWPRSLSVARWKTASQRATSVAINGAI